MLDCNTNRGFRIMLEKNYMILRVEYVRSACLIPLLAHLSYSIGLDMTSRTMSPFLAVPCGPL